MVVESAGFTEVVLIDRMRTVWYYDGSDWALEYIYYEDGTNFLSKAVIEVASRNFIAVNLSEPKIVRIKDGAAKVEVPVQRPLAGFGTAINFPAVGTLAAATLGSIYSDTSDEGTWEPFMSTEASVNAGSFAAVGDLLVVGNIYGEVELIFPKEKRSCGSQRLDPVIDRLDVVLRVGERLLVSGGRVTRNIDSRFAVVSLE